MKKFVEWAFVVIVLCCFLLAGCNLVKTNSSANSANNSNSATDDSLTKIKERGVMIVGTCAELPPMDYRDENGTIIGMDMDIARVIASDIGVSDVEFRHFEWADMLNAAATGQVDFSIASIIITPERNEIMLFSVPYFDAGESIITLADNENITGPDDFKNFRIGVVKGTVQEKTALKYVNASDLVLYDNFDTVLTDLLDKKIDLTMNDYGMAVVWTKKDPALKMVGVPFTQDYYGIATKLGDNALMDEINSVLRDMKRTGKLKELEDKWLK